MEEVKNKISNYQQNKNLLQDKFLLDTKSNKRQVSIILVNGFQMHDIVLKDFDSFCLLVVDNQEKESLIFKHAISTII